VRAGESGEGECVLGGGGDCRAAHICCGHSGAGSDAEPHENATRSLTLSAVVSMPSRSSTS
jgi:hypothetical protein